MAAEYHLRIARGGKEKLEVGFFPVTPNERHVMVGILFVFPPTADEVGVGLGGAEVDQRDFLLHFGKRKVFDEVVMERVAMIDLLLPVTSVEESDENEQEGEEDGYGSSIHGMWCGHVLGSRQFPFSSSSRM